MYYWEYMVLVLGHQYTNTTCTSNTCTSEAYYCTTLIHCSFLVYVPTVIHLKPLNVALLSNVGRLFLVWILGLCIHVSKLLTNTIGF
jgi:hypothetical protein